MSSVLHTEVSSEFISELTSSSDENKENIPPNGLQLRKKVMMGRKSSRSSIPTNGLQSKKTAMKRRKVSNSSISDENKENIPPQGLQFSDENKENIPPQGLKPKRKEMLRPLLSSSSISIDDQENFPLQELQSRKQEMLHPELPPLVQAEDLEREISKTIWIKRFFGWILRGNCVDQLTDVFFLGCRLIKKIFWMNLPRACKRVLPHFGILGLFIGPSLDEATCEVVDGLAYAAVYVNTWRKRRYAPIIGLQRNMMGIQSAVVPSPIRSLNSAALQFASERQLEDDISD